MPKKAGSGGGGYVAGAPAQGSPPILSRLHRTLRLRFCQSSESNDEPRLYQRPAPYWLGISHLPIRVAEAPELRPSLSLSLQSLINVPRTGLLLSAEEHSDLRTSGYAGFTLAIAILRTGNIRQRICTFTYAHCWPMLAALESQALQGVRCIHSTVHFRHSCVLMQYNRTSGRLVCILDQ
ncbi:hypothetical protein OE88DRAFT_549154 [Heliocybe sulcata]|uniref:Uncharacterized protein n=1 Tax=Heliocybe sulcata TaxID=5364 RepID=A0A5C3MTA0_9AGAM|nr:hypothetical protein OE88DRAFT_549154 [Heliocybe sulcata]